MSRRPLRCRFGMHSYVRRHPDGERPSGPDDEVCRHCGKQTGAPFGSAPWVLPG
ncbi:hypothetical protein [Geodermatophilus sp. SYSU D01119]